MTIKNAGFFVSIFCSLWMLVSAQPIPLHPFLDSTITSWYRFSVEETGVQKLDKNFLKQLGIPIDNVDPKTLRVFGRGGQMLPLKNAAEVETLYENALWVVGEDNGSFDDEDYILFMGYAGDTWNAESQTFKNLYHNTATYYITYGTSDGKRVVVENGKEVVSSTAVHAGIYQTVIEEDKYNIGSLGRRWFGERFTDGQKETYTLQTPNVLDGTTIDVVARVASAANIKTSFNFSIGDESKTSTLGSKGSTIIATEPSTRFNSLSGAMQLQSSATDEVTTELEYIANGDFSSYGYLDFILAQYSRKLSGSGTSFLFTLDAKASVQELVISEATPETSLWELNSDKVHTPPVDATTFGVDIPVNGEKFFFLASDYKTPTFRRNSRTFSPPSFLAQINKLPTTTYLLITSEAYRDEAERLITHRQEKRELQAQLVTLEEIYEAFSTGQQDIAAIRNFVRYLYDSQGKQLKYLCLFGDTSFDYQKRTRSNDMIVPTFHALSSFSLSNSFMSDDFFTMMDAGEGLLGSVDEMDLAVGRMVFSNKTQATVAVDKVMAYESPENKGSWNNSFTILADDADYFPPKNDYTLQIELNQVADNLTSENQFLNMTKLLADSYKQEASAGGDSYPEVKLALENRLSQGTLAVQYFGHGGEDGLASEFLMDKKMAQSLFHPGKYPLFIVVTCEFTRFDNHDRQTAGELLYQNPTGGALGLISTTRQIYVNEGIAFNKLITKYLFPSNRDETTSIAEALRKAKSEFRNTNQKRVIFCIGDPALKLNAPKPKVDITHVNGVPIESATDDQKTMNALKKITLSGVLSNPNGEIQKDFNGEVTLQVFDKNQIRNVLNNDGNPSHKENPFDFQVIGKQIFQGLSTVKDGKFTFNYVVPKDIDLDLGEARLTMIAFNEDKSESLGGYSDKLRIGGLNSLAPEDNQGPKIDVYLNDSNFIDGDRVFSSPALIIDLADENGINTAGGIGHDITAVLDNNQMNPLVLNAFYSTALDDFTKGTLSYPLNNLATGAHTLTVKAWDTYNNPSTKTIAFWVMDNSDIKIERVFNSPNPVTNQTTFFVQHNRPRELLKANLYIFTMDGKRIYDSSQNVSSSGYLLDSLRWDATSYSGQKVNKGTYLYTIELISALSQSNDTYSAKLIIK